MEIRPVITAGRPYIERYGPGGFKINGTIFTGAVLILPDAAQAWAVSSMAEVTPESLEEMAAEHGGVEILLLGSGQRMQLVPRALRQALQREVGISDRCDGQSGRPAAPIMCWSPKRRDNAAALLPMTA